MSNTTIAATLKQYKELKRNLVGYLQIQEKHVQKCAIELIEIARENNNILTPNNVYAYVSTHPETLFYKLLDWTKEEEYIKGFIGRLLDKIPMLIDELNNVYEITKGD